MLIFKALVRASRLGDIERGFVMPGKRYCPYEKTFCPENEFEDVGGTLVHRTHPTHRWHDGAVGRIVDQSRFVRLDPEPRAEGPAAEVAEDLQ